MQRDKIKVEYWMQIALKCEATARIKAPRKLRINKSVKSSPGRMWH